MDEALQTALQSMAANSMEPSGSVKEEEGEGEVRWIHEFVAMALPGSRHQVSIYRYIACKCMLQCTMYIILLYMYIYMYIVHRILHVVFIFYMYNVHVCNKVTKASLWHKRTHTCTYSTCTCIYTYVRTHVHVCVLTLYIIQSYIVVHEVILHVHVHSQGCECGEEEEE